MKIDRVSVIALNRVLEKKGRRQQFFDSWKPRFFVLKDGVIEHWREQKVRLPIKMFFLVVLAAERMRFIGHTITNDSRISTAARSSETRCSLSAANSKLLATVTSL